LIDALPVVSLKAGYDCSKVLRAYCIGIQNGRPFGRRSKQINMTIDARVFHGRWNVSYLPGGLEIAALGCSSWNVGYPNTNILSLCRPVPFNE
jgi:hypothetical protein